MSKYIYATVYEQFTGLKPPEPKSHKPRRRRGYGHPYRMRLNMQENEHEETEEENKSVDSFDSASTIDHKFEQPRLNDNFEINPGNADHSLKSRSDTITNRTCNRSSRTLFSVNTPARKPIEEKVARVPKVTYKKRRHFLDNTEN